MMRYNDNLKNVQQRPFSRDWVKVALKNPGPSIKELKKENAENDGHKEHSLDRPKLLRTVHTALAMLSKSRFTIEDSVGYKAEIYFSKKTSVILFCSML